LLADKIGRQKSVENIGQFFKTDARFSSADKMDDDDDAALFYCFSKEDVENVKRTDQFGSDPGL